MKTIHLLLIPIIVLLITACSYDDLAEKFIPQEEAKFAEEYINKLREKDLVYIKNFMRQDILSKATDEKLLEMADYFRDGELISTTLIGSQVHTFNDQWQGNFSFEYQFTSGWNLANAALTKTDNNIEVIGLNVYQTEKSQKEINAFSLSSKSPLQYLVLVLAVTVPLFIVVTTYFCARTPLPKRKWLWIVFILLGLGSVSINWTTGQFGINPLSFHLLGAAATSGGPYAPWVISASLPLGAILFWFKRKQYLSEFG